MDEENALTQQLRKQITSLTNELADVRKLLADLAVEKKQLQVDKAELTHLVGELRTQIEGTSSMSIASQSAVSMSNAADVPSASEELLSDRAKRTMMQLRLERNEEKQRDLLRRVKGAANAVATQTKMMRTAIQRVHSDVEDQFRRMGEFLDNSSISLSERIELMKKQAAARGPEPTTSQPPPRSPSPGLGSPSDNADYLSIVTAAVQEQHRNVVLAPDHPVLVKLGTFLDQFDNVISDINGVWSSMSCFSAGKPPTLKPPRRYVDPQVNLSNYQSVATTLQTHAAHAKIMNMIYSDMCLPEQEARCNRDIEAVFHVYSNKLSNLFESMRTIRTPVVIRKNTLSNALRIAGSLELSRADIQEIDKTYESISREHTARCFRYIGRMLTIGKRFADEKPAPKAADDEWISGLSSDDMASASMPVPGLGHDDPLVIESIRNGGDFYNIMRHSGKRRQLYVQRRDEMRKFTEARVMHLQILSGLIDKIARVLKRYKLIAADGYIEGRSGGHHHHNGGGRSGSVSLLSGSRSRSMSLSHPMIPLADSPRTRSPQKRNGGGGGGRGHSPPHQTSSRFRFEPHEQMLATSTVNSSEYYFATKRGKRLDADQRKVGTLLGGAGQATVDDELVNKALEGAPKLNYGKDLELLEKLTPRKPSTPFAFPRQTPVRMTPMEGQRRPRPKKAGSPSARQPGPVLPKTAH